MSATAIVDVRACACFKVIALGFAEIVKFPSTVRSIVVVFVSDPLVPYIVITDVPVVAEALAVSVTTVEVVEDDGLKDAVTPLGSALVVNVTFPAKPPDGVTAIVDSALVP